ncbi:hypothetical protein L9F63_020778 [Diploptera punctata]|uniref:Sensory neuron membrane protein 2 n=1 Tax=Diploptera punctata TaxID=6984 RepID=A0AAD8EC49_DIPPU|nr:hypothetical protein L9F63_020778 [Diploptera punctata]
MKHRNLILCTGLSGFVVFVAGVALGWFGFPVIILREVRNGVVLANDSEAFERWRKLPIPIQYKVYLFNVTNPDDVMQGANPIVQEVGPYHYDEYREKYDIVSEEDDTLSYYENTTFFFNQEMSGNNSPDDVINFLNVALLGSVLTVQKQYGTSAFGMVSTVVETMFIESDSVFRAATVRSLLWEGVTVINCSSSKFICDMMRNQLPKTMVESAPGVFDFSFFGYKNSTNNGKIQNKQRDC